MLDKKIQKAISEAFAQLYKHELAENEVVLQPTRREFEGSYTFVVFPYLKVTKGKPEDSGGADRRLAKRKYRLCEFI